MAKQLDTLKEMSQVLDKTEEAIQKYYDAVEQLPKKDAKILEDFKKVRDTLNCNSFFIIVFFLVYLSMTTK